MSVLFLPPSAGAASVPDASETVSGKIRISTSAEATAGTDDLTAMTPAKVKSVVDASIVGGVTYKGTFDASAPLDLSNAEQGDLYVIDGAGTYQGIVWAVGDHLLVNADMGGTVDPNKIDKIDSTDSVTSVAGRTGAVTLSTADISGLATVASTGAYSDLTGTPTLATVATTGAYSDLSGTPTLATVATTGAYSDLSGTPTLGTAAALDVGTSASNVVQLNGSAQLPAVDGSLLTGITATVAALDDIGDVNITSVQDYSVLKYDSGTSEWIDAPQLNYVFSSTTQSLDLKPGVNRVAMGGSSSITLTLGISTLVSGQGVVFSVLNTGSADHTLTIGSTSWTFAPQQGGVFQATGLNTAYMVSTIDYNQLENLPTLGTAAALDVGTSASNVVQLDGSARLPAVDGSQLTNLPSSSVAALDDIGDVTITSVADGQFLKYDSTSGDWVNGDSGLYDGYTISTTGAMTTPSQPKTLTARLNSSSNQTLTLPTASADLLGTTISLSNISTGVWTISAAAGQYIRGLSSAPTLAEDQSLILTLVTFNVWYVVAYEEQGLGSLSDVDVTGAVATNVLKYDGTGWVDGAVAYSEVTGTPTLGTAAALDVGTSANNVVQLNGSAQLPAVDGSLLTGITATVSALNDIGDVSAAAPNNGDVIAYNSTSGDWEATAQSGGGGSAPSVTVSSPSTDQTLTSPSGLEEIYIYLPTAAITVNLVAAATCGSGFKYQIKNRSGNTLTIDPNGTETIDGSATFAISDQEASVTLVTDGANWFVI